MSIQPIYEIYKKTAAGGRGQIINDIVSLTHTIRWNEPGKWKMTGAGLTPCPLAEGSGILIFRNGAVALSGFLQEASDEFDAATRIYDWSAEGLSDLGRTAHRLIWVDPDAEKPVIAEELTATGYLSDVLLTFVDMNGGEQSQDARLLPNLSLGEYPHIGDEVTFEAKYDELLSYVLDKLKGGTLGIRDAWNPATGKWAVEIYQPRDVSSKVVFSVESGSLSGWERTITAPEGNWLLVQGCEKTNANGESTGETLCVVVEDTASIAKWGRIEKKIDRTDIKQIIEKDEEGTTTYTEPWESVLQRLEEAALEELAKCSAQYGYKLTTVDVDRFEYGKDWDIGDTVAVRVGSEQFTAQIEEINIEYSAGAETVTPSVGTVQRGELQTVFDELGRLKDQVKILQKGAMK